MRKQPRYVDWLVFLIVFGVIGFVFIITGYDSWKNDKAKREARLADVTISFESGSGVFGVDQRAFGFRPLPSDVNLDSVDVRMVPMQILNIDLDSGVVEAQMPFGNTFLFSALGLSNGKRGDFFRIIRFRLPDGTEYNRAETIPDTAVDQFSGVFVRDSVYQLEAGVVRVIAPDQLQ